MAILLASVGLFQSDVTNSGTAEPSDGWMGGNVLFTTLSSQTSARLPALSSKLLANPLVERYVLTFPICRACRTKMDDIMMMCSVVAFVEDICKSLLQCLEQPEMSLVRFDISE